MDTAELPGPQTRRARYQHCNVIVSSGSSYTETDDIAVTVIEIDGTTAVRTCRHFMQSSFITSYSTTHALASIDSRPVNAEERQCFFILPAESTPLRLKLRRVFCRGGLESLPLGCQICQEFVLLVHALQLRVQLRCVLAGNGVQNQLIRNGFGVVRLQN